MGCNQAFARDAGLSCPEEIIGRTDFDMAWRANAHICRQGDIATIGGGVAKLNYEEPQSRADGSASWLRTSKIPLADMQGNTVAVLGLYEDITERKAMVNDSFGHDTGDAVLKAFALRVSDTLREMDVFARLGGDEFALLLENLPNFAAAKRVAGKLLASMQVPHQLGERAITVSTSIGVAFFQRGMRADELIRRADQAMYDAKRAGRNRFEITAAA